MRRGGRAIRAAGGEAAVHLDLADRGLDRRLRRRAPVARGRRSTSSCRAPGRTSRTPPSTHRPAPSRHPGGEPGRRPPARRSPGAGHDRPAPRRPGLRHLGHRARPRPHKAAYVASKWGLEGYARTLQMELEGTGRPRLHRAARPDAVRHGDRLGPRDHHADPGRVGPLGIGPPRPLPRPRPWPTPWCRWSRRRRAPT